MHFGEAPVEVVEGVHNVVVKCRDDVEQRLRALHVGEEVRQRGAVGVEKAAGTKGVCLQGQGSLTCPWEPPLACGRPRNAKMLGCASPGEASW